MPSCWGPPGVTCRDHPGRPGALSVWARKRVTQEDRSRVIVEVHGPPPQSAEKEEVVVIDETQLSRHGGIWWWTACRSGKITTKFLHQVFLLGFTTMQVERTSTTSPRAQGKYEAHRVVLSLRVGQKCAEELNHIRCDDLPG